MERTRPRSSLRTLQAVLAAGLASGYLAHVFQFDHGLLLRAGLGTWLDSYFINVLLEHWYDSIIHLTSPLSPPMYFPTRGVLGYSHALVLYVPFYVLVRPFSAPFAAHTLTIFLVMDLGLICLYQLLREYLRRSFVESLILVAFFGTSANVINAGASTWSQRASVFLIPPIVLLGLTAARMPAGHWRLWLGALSGALFALLFAQDPYTAEFTVLVGGLLLIPAIVWARAPAPPGTGPSPWWFVIAVLGFASSLFVHVHPIREVWIAGWTFSAVHDKRPLYVAIPCATWFVLRWLRPRACLDVVRAVPRRLAAMTAGSAYLKAVGAGLAVGSAVFLWIYAASFIEHQGFPLEQLMHSLTPREPASWHGPFDLETLSTAYEGNRVFLFSALASMLLVIPWFGATRTQRRLAVWLACMSALVLAVALRFGEWSVWWTAFGSIPGFSIIRDPRRIIYVFELAVVLVTALLLSLAGTKARMRTAIAALMVALMAYEWNDRTFQFERDVSDFTRWVKAPIAIDPSCRSFFIKGASDEYMSRSGHKWSLYGVDAMFVALDHRIPTINGYSAWWPDGFNDMDNPQNPPYQPAVDRWITRFQLHDVCQLDIETRTMKSYVP